MENNETSKNKYMLPASILIAGIMISVSVLYSLGGKGQVANVGGQLGADGAQLGGQTPPAANVALTSDDAVLGIQSAKVAFIEYADYQCPFCARFYSDATKFVKENYLKTGKVKMAYRNFAFLGPESLVAAEATMCAKDQGKFWEFHDGIFEAELKDAQENNGNLNREFFMKLAGDLKLDTKAFGTCIDSKKYAAAVQKGNSDANAVGVNSTPMSFINGKLISGACPAMVIDQAIQAELSGKKWSVDRCQIALQ